MMVLREGMLELTLPPGVRCRKFDSPTHGLQHCMKAVDFIVEEPNLTIFIEFKDPDNPHATPDKREEFLQELLAGTKDDDLVRKYRDSFLYCWAENKVENPIVYFVLIAASQLDEAMLLAITDVLKRKLPLKGPPGWKRRIVSDCSVFNLESWNKHLPRYRIRRI